MPSMRVEYQGVGQKLPKVREILRKKLGNLKFSNHPMVEEAAVFLETIVKNVFAYEHFPYDFHQIWTFNTDVRDIFSL